MMEFLRKSLVEIVLLLYFLIYLTMLDVHGVYKTYWVYFVFIITCCILFYRKRRCREIIRTFVSYGDSKILTRIAAYSSICGWGCFAVSLPFINLNLRFISNILIALFCGLIIISSMLMIYVSDSPLKKRIFSIEFISIVSLAYAISNAYSSGLFLQISNLPLDNTPWVAFWWKFVALIILISLILQPFSFYVCLKDIDKAKGARLLTFLGGLAVTTLIVTLIPKHLSSIAYIAINKTIDFEWRDEATCGNITDKAKGEKYFGFNAEKYTVYFSNRNGTWGFDELKCVKTDQGIFQFQRQNVSTEHISDWLK